jgi:hypothetical protein
MLIYARHGWLPSDSSSMLIKCAFNTIVIEHAVLAAVEETEWSEHSSSLQIPNPVRISGGQSRQELWHVLDV